MKIDILTLFPGMFENVLGESMMKRAREKGLAQIEVHDLRAWTEDNHRTADDKPYGGGPGMVMKVEPVDKALSDLKKDIEEESAMTILLTPQGQRFNQDTAKALATCGHMILVCGHYEGVDERIRELVDMELSIGDYVLTCGEVPAMVVSDTVVRLIPGVLGDAECLVEESFEDGFLEYPQYTRPSEYKNMSVPEVLLSGNPKKIDEWRREQALHRTKVRRPDLLD